MEPRPYDSYRIRHSHVTRPARAIALRQRLASRSCQKRGTCSEATRAQATCANTPIELHRSNGWTVPADGPCRSRTTNGVVRHETRGSETNDIRVQQCKCPETPNPIAGGAQTPSLKLLVRIAFRSPTAARGRLWQRGVAHRERRFSPVFFGVFLLFLTSLPVRTSSIAQSVSALLPDSAR